jgi:plastocyanin
MAGSLRLDCRAMGRSWPKRSLCGAARMGVFAVAAAMAPAEQAAPPASTPAPVGAPAADETSRAAGSRGATTDACVLVGRVPVSPRKTVGGAKGAYAGRTTERPEEPDPPASVVWMTGTFAPRDPATTQPAVLEQQGLQFRPAVLAVQVGTPVIFPNKDPIYHSVFSYSAAKKFDLGRYRTGEEPPAVVFDKPGTVSLFCEVHDHMRGSIVVVDSPHFVRTDAQGNFRLEGLPAGAHSFRVWLGPKETVEHTVELKPGQTLTVDWTGGS